MRQACERATIINHQKLQIMITLEEREFHAKVKTRLERIESILGDIAKSLDSLSKIMEEKL